MAVFASRTNAAEWNGVFETSNIILIEYVFRVVDSNTTSPDFRVVLCSIENLFKTTY